MCQQVSDFLDSGTIVLYAKEQMEEVRINIPILAIFLMYLFDIQVEALGQLPQYKSKSSPPHTHTHTHCKMISKL